MKILTPLSFFVGLLILCGCNEAEIAQLKQKAVLLDEQARVLAENLQDDLTLLDEEVARAQKESATGQQEIKKQQVKLDELERAKEQLTEQAQRPLPDWEANDTLTLLNGEVFTGRTLTLKGGVLNYEGPGGRKSAPLSRFKRVQFRSGPMPDR